jgi:hypothetical protein
MSILKSARRRYSATERLGEKPERKSIGRSLFEVFASGQQRGAEREVNACLARHDRILPDKRPRCRAAPIRNDTPNVGMAGTLARASDVGFCEASLRAGQTFERETSMRYRRWFVAIATTMAAISVQGRASALSKSSPSASIAQSEAASITAHGGGMTLQDCMALWDAATHMSKQEWKAACKRTMVFDFPDEAR